MTKKKEAVTEGGNGYHEEDRSPLAATLAARHIINPGEDKLQEVSYLSYGMVHSLEMLQTYEKMVPQILEQIRERRHWYLNRQIKRMKRINTWSQLEEDEAKEQYKADIESLDTVDVQQLFMHQLRISVYQHSRGKDGKFIESLVILGDTDMQTRAADEGDSGFGSRPIRSQ